MNVFQYLYCDLSAFVQHLCFRVLCIFFSGNTFFAPNSKGASIPMLKSVCYLTTRRIFAFTRASCLGETLVLLDVVSQGFFGHDGLSCNCFCIGMLKMQGYYLCIQAEVTYRSFSLSRSKKINQKPFSE